LILRINGAEIDLNSLSLALFQEKEKLMETIFAIGMPGGPEMIFIVLIILLLFGAKKIPDLAKGFGKGIREFKDATKEIKKEVDDAGDEIKKS